MPGLTSEMEDQHRVFLQGMMCQGILNTKQVNALHEKSLRICGIEVPEKRKEMSDLLVQNMHTINDHLTEVGLVVRKGVDEDNGDSYFMLVNTQARMVTGGGRELGAGVQSHWSPGELDYLRLVATEILQSEEKSVSSRVALNLTDKVVANKRMTMEAAEKTVNRLIESRWLKILGDGNIGLDVRFLGEMENWMLEVVGGVAKCQLCRKVVVRGVYCDCGELEACHRYCLVKQAGKLGAAVKCKKCGVVMHQGGRDVVEQEAGEEEETATHKGEPSKTGKRKVRSVSNGEKSPEAGKGRIVRRVESSDSE